MAFRLPFYVHLREFLRALREMVTTRTRTVELVMGMPDQGPQRSALLYLRHHPGGALDRPGALARCADAGAPAFFGDPRVLDCGGFPSLCKAGKTHPTR